MKKQHEINEEITPLNDKLFAEFSIEQLESRLETDPLMLTTMFTGNGNPSTTDWCVCDGAGCLIRIGGGKE